MEYALLALVVAGFAITLGGVWLRRRKQAPLRREVRSQSVTFWISLTEVKQREGDGFMKWLSLNSIMALYVRSDSFEISSMILPIRVVMGMEYYFRARETFIEVSKEPSRLSAYNWIIVTGRQGNKEIQLAFTNRDEDKLHDAWNALAAAGAVPIGPGPNTPARLDR